MYITKAYNIKNELLCFSSFINVVVYFALTLNITNTSGDIFLNFTITFVLETVAYGLCIIGLQYFGRKPLYLAAILTGGACCAVCILPVMLNAPGKYECVKAFLSLISCKTGKQLFS